MLPARRVPAVSEGAMRDWAEQLVVRAREEGVELTGEDGLLTGQVRQVLQTGLEVELADHLGYEAHDPVGRGSGNSRNGSYPKTVVTEVGDVELRMPRDRNGTFEPVTVPKHTRRLDGLAGNVISLYAKGLTTGELASLPASPRLVRCLLRLAVTGEIGQSRQHSRVDVGLTQTELAEATGLHRSTVADLLRQLRNDGVIITARRRIVISDMARLQNWAE